MSRAAARLVRQRTAALALLAAIPAVARAQDARVQDALVNRRAEEIGPVFERWSFGSGGLPRNAGDDGSPRIKSATQLSVPIVAVVPLGERWTFDLAGAYATGTVKLDRVDSTTHGDTYKLSGPTDVKLRMVGAFRDDHLMLTLGANVPTGKTKLDVEEFRALQALGAPALRFRTPGLGTGFGGTVGVVGAREVGRWAMALGASYEVRGKYQPIEALSAGFDTPDLDPGDAIHLSLGIDGLIGRNRSSVRLFSDFFTKDKLTLDFGGGTSGVDYKLGPSLGGEWTLAIASSRFRDLGLVVAERFRGAFQDAGGNTVSGSSGNEVDAGLAGILPFGAGRTGLSLGVDGRFLSGLDVDDTPATAAARVFGATVGLALDGALSHVRPFVRAQLGTLESANRRTSGNGIGAGLTFQASF